MERLVEFYGGVGGVAWRGGWSSMERLVEFYGGVGGVAWRGGASLYLHNIIFY